MENKKLLLGTLCLSLSLCQGAMADETSPSVEAKVLNGEAAKNLASDLLPWQAAILSQPNILGQTISSCGAVVISDYWAVTAAHCAEPSAGLSNTLVAGTTYIPQGRADTVASQYQFTIVQKIVHSGYTGTGGSEFIGRGDMDYDIALLKIDPNGRPLTSVAKAIKIATPDEQQQANSEFANTWNATGYSPGNLIGSGWGKMAPYYDIADELQVVKLGGIPMSMCDAAYLTTENSKFVCADSNNPEIKKDVCQGDSGGPLIWQNKEKAGQDDLGLRLVGVTSNGPICEEKNKGNPTQQTNGLYTELAAYYGWIEQQTGLDLDTLATSKFTQNPFDLVREDQTVQSQSSSSSSGGSVPLGALAALTLAAVFRRKK